jgi:hypothetical protein
MVDRSTKANAPLGCGEALRAARELFGLECRSRPAS